MSLSPVVTGSGLSEDEVVWSEELTERSGSDGVHGSWLKIHKDGSWDVSSTGGFVIVDVDSLELEIGITVIGTGRVNTVLVGDDLPELGTDLVTALTGLDVNELAHFGKVKSDDCGRRSEKRAAVGAGVSGRGGRGVGKSSNVGGGGDRGGSERAERMKSRRNMFLHDLSPITAAPNRTNLAPDDRGHEIRAQQRERAQRELSTDAV